MICWELSDLDCKGNIEPAAIYYFHEATVVPPQGFISCTLEDGTESTCPFPAIIPPFSPYRDFSGCADTPEPSLGEVVMLRTKKVDEAGNEDCSI